MTELQQELLKLLCEIDEICRKHDIDYMLFAGSALGAERHHGFIPWDDDADILMTLENYEKFIVAAEAELGPDRALNALENGTEGYFLSYGRYVDTGTTAIQRHTAFGGCDPGVKVDIFCAVPTWDDETAAEAHKQQILAFCEAICRYGIMYPYRDEAFFPYYEEACAELAEIGRAAYIEKQLPALQKRWNGKGKPGKYILFAGIMSNSYILDADILEETKYVPFEDTMLPISANNIAFSKVLYGEGWLNVPYNIEQPRHTMLLDLEEPFAKYIAQLQQDASFSEKEAIVAKRRQIHLEERSAFRDVTVNRQKILNLVAEQSVMNQFREMPEDKRSSWREMETLFQSYYRMQLHKNNRFFKLLIPLSEEAFVCAIQAAVVMGKYDIASDILKLTQDGLPFATDVMVLLEKEVQQCIDVIETMYLKRDPAALDSLMSGIDDPVVKESATAKLAGLWLQAQQAADERELETLCRRIDETMAAYGSTGEFLALQGLCMTKMGKKAEAACLYQEAIKKVRNAVIFQQLLDGGFSPYDETEL